MNNLLKSASKAYKSLFKNKSYKPQDIEQYSDLINDTNAVFEKALKSGLKDAEIPIKMRNALDKDVFLFSALKTHTQLFEASRLLTDENGEIKSFRQFSKDISDIKRNYNQTYLEAEYQFAVSSSQQAANWAQVEEGGDRYNLQYRTAGDSRVRKTHEELNGITLPSGDVFWNEYYPPNGWRCRCKAVKVLKSKYEETSSAAAMEKGEKATTNIGKNGKNKLAIFRFNPGKQKVVFPPDHPYYPKTCGGNLSVYQGMPTVFLANDKGKCNVKSIANNLFEEKQKTKRNQYLELLESSINRSVSKTFGGNTIKIKFNNKKGLKHFVNDVITKTNRINKNDLSKIHGYIKNSKPMPRVGLYKDRNDGIDKFYYLYDKKRNVYYHIAERPEKKKNGQIRLFRFLHGVTNEI